MTSLDLSEFEPTEESDWREKIAADLAGRGAKVSLLWEPEPDLVLDGVATRSSLDRATVRLSKRPRTPAHPRWTSVQFVPLHDDGDDDARLAIALERADRVLLRCDPGKTDTMLQIIKSRQAPHGDIVVDCTGQGKDIDLDPLIKYAEALMPDALLPWTLSDGDTSQSIATDYQAPSVTIDTRPLRAAVDSVVIECAVTAAAIDFHRSVAHQIPINVVTPIGPKLFLEVAKLIALHGLSQQAFHETDSPPQSSSESKPARVSGVQIWAVTGVNGSSTNRQEHQVRLTYALVAGILGGAACLVSNPYTADPDDVALAANAQLILRHESDLAVLSDTLPGSYYVGAASSAIAARASTLSARLAAAGGLNTTAGVSILRDAVAAHRQVERR